MIQEGLPPPFLAFLDLFNRGEYWESHEALEAPWRRHGSPFYQGLIILASAYVHRERANLRGVSAQLGKAVRYLEPFRPTYHGLDVAELVNHANQALRRLERAEGAGRAVADVLLPDLVLAIDRTRIRGDEPELIDLRPEP